ncbi:hypothetical protein [Ferrimicrobium sp.]|uniref:hypothetical protein n=1 Tax=Ferrimicrobium sp. TaxID=2926050 RepID=UPI002631E217|nr:hypothetical protein [Ferrimicrobium sp.]
MGAVVDSLGADSLTIDEAGLSSLSPLGHHHIGMLVRYSFNVPESVAQERLRLLADATHAPATLTAFFVPLLPEPQKLQALTGSRGTTGDVVSRASTTCRSFALEHAAT